MPPRRTRTSTREASTSRRRRREPTPPPPPSPPPPPLPWELPIPIQNTRYRMLHKRTVVPSKFFDAYTVQTLGIQDDVNLFVKNIGWTQFAGMRFPTYKSITYEILSTLSSTYHPHIEGDPPSIFFRCMGEDRQLNMAQFNNIFGFPNAGLSWNHPDFNPTRAWRQLTSLNEYNPSASKSTHIRNHALRYIHRVMSLSLFGRGLSRGVVSKVELLFLWAMANEVQVNTGVWILKHLLHVAKSPKGNICVGGLLSIIADAFGFVPIEGLHQVMEGSNLVDMETIINMRLCRHIGDGHYRLIDVEGNIIEPDEEEAEEEEEEAEPQDQEPIPEHEEVNEGDFNAHNPEHEEVDMGAFNAPQPDMPMMQLMERFDRLEARMSRSEDFQLQMMNLLQQNAAATARMEDKLNNLK